MIERSIAIGVGAEPTESDEICIDSPHGLKVQIKPDGRILVNGKFETAIGVYTAERVRRALRAALQSEDPIINEDHLGEE